MNCSVSGKCLGDVLGYHPSVSPEVFGSLTPPHQRAGDHVVQRLLTFGEAGHDVANEENHPRNILRKVPASGTGE